MSDSSHKCGSADAWRGERSRARFFSKGAHNLSVSLCLQGSSRIGKWKRFESVLGQNLMLSSKKLQAYVILSHSLVDAYF